MYDLPSIAKRLVSDAFMCASMLVSPRRINFVCHIVSVPNAMTTADKKNRTLIDLLAPHPFHSIRTDIDECHEYQCPLPRYSISIDDCCLQIVFGWQHNIIVLVHLRLNIDYIGG